ncbi:MAG: hypothetical protein HGB19_09060 [Chlorobiales bacterium]|nr:hypothetical protein [Chlorobiales bacterium]
MKIGFLSKAAATLVLVGMFGCGPNAEQVKLLNEIKTATLKVDSVSAPVAEALGKLKADHEKFAAIYDTLKTAGKSTPAADSIMAAHHQIITQCEADLAKFAEAAKENKGIEEKFVKQIGKGDEMKSALEKITAQTEEIQKAGEKLTADAQKMTEGHKMLEEIKAAAAAPAVPEKGAKKGKK